MIAEFRASSEYSSLSDFNQACLYRLPSDDRGRIWRYASRGAFQFLRFVANSSGGGTAWPAHHARLITLGRRSPVFFRSPMIVGASRRTHASAARGLYEADRGGEDIGLKDHVARLLAVASPDDRDGRIAGALDRPTARRSTATSMVGLRWKIHPAAPIKDWSSVTIPVSKYLKKILDGANRVSTQILTSANGLGRVPHVVE